MVYGVWGIFNAYKASKWQWPPVATLLASVDNQTGADCWVVCVVL